MAINYQQNPPYPSPGIGSALLSAAGSALGVCLPWQTAGPDHYWGTGQVRFFLVKEMSWGTLLVSEITDWLITNDDDDL